MFLLTHSPEPYYDVAVWEVRPVTFGPYVRPICLPSAPSDNLDRHVGDAAETMGKIPDASGSSTWQTLTDFQAGVS